MSNLPVYTGQWIDWSRGSVLGSYRTFSVRDTLYITGATATFLAYVGGSVWSIYAFFLHRQLSKNLDPDIINLQHRLIYRNDSTATAAAVDGFWLYSTWKPWKLCGHRRWKYLKTPHGRPRRANCVGLRTCGLMAPALLIFATFAVAGIFGSHIAKPAYSANTVLMQDQSDQGLCGIALFDGSIASLPDFDVKAATDTRAALAYARSCYSTASGVINSAACNLFAKRKLEYSASGYNCPFGDPQQPVESSMCAFNDNTAAYGLRTVLLDSHDDFGINAPPGDRVQLLKELICSPLVIDGFNDTGPAHGEEAQLNITVANYNYGAYPNGANATYQYNSASAYDNVPFEINAVLHNATGPAQWIPISNLTRTDADVTIVFIAPNSITFRKQVVDPVFRATYATTDITNWGDRFTVYTPDFQVVVIGCTEQYSICNPSLKTNSCTPPSGQNDLLNLIQSYKFNSAQLVTVYRMIYMIVDGTTYSSVSGIGADALQMWNSVYNFVSPGIPPNQWQIEIEGWLQTTLAKWQAYMVAYANNTADLGSHGHVGFPVANGSLDKEWRAQCKSQKISNLGSYQNVTVFGFAFAWAGGFVIVLVSWFLRFCVKTQRNMLKRTDKKGPRDRRIAWNIDGKFQLHRVALRTVGYRELAGGEDDIPFLEGPLPADSALKESLPNESGPEKSFFKKYLLKKERSPRLPFYAGEVKVPGREEADTIFKNVETSESSGTSGTSGNGTFGHHAENTEVDASLIATNPPPPPQLPNSAEDDNSPGSNVAILGQRSPSTLQGRRLSSSHRSSVDLHSDVSPPSSLHSTGPLATITTPGEVTTTTNINNSNNNNNNNQNDSWDSAHINDDATVIQAREPNSIEARHDGADAEVRDPT